MTSAKMLKGLGYGFLLLALLLILSTMLFAQDINRAAVVVRYGDDAVETRCVTFDEPHISGYELLQRSGLTVDAKFEGMGGLMCRIEETGCPAEDCFCQCKGGDECTYWSYWHQGDEGWSYAPIGATDYQVDDGDVDGWSWGPGSLTDAIEPPAVSLDEVCETTPIESDNSAPEVSEPETNPIAYLTLGLLILILGGSVLLMRRRRERHE